MRKNGIRTTSLQRSQEGRGRRTRSLRKKYGNPKPIKEPSAFRTIRSIAYFAVLGLIILGTLYWIFG